MAIKYQHKATWSFLASRGLSFGKCTPCHNQFMSCKSSLVIIQHPPLRVIDKVEWTNTLPKHATSHWASGTVMQNKQGGLAAGVGDAQLSGGYLPAFYNNQQEYGAKCHEKNSVTGWACGGRSDGAVEHRRKVGCRPKGRCSSRLDSGDSSIRKHKRHWWIWNYTGCNVT